MKMSSMELLFFSESSICLPVYSYMSLCVPMSTKMNRPTTDPQVVFVIVVVLIFVYVCAVFLFFLLDHGFIPQKWGNLSKHSFLSLLIHSFSTYYVLGMP